MLCVAEWPCASLTVNDGNDGETVTFARMDPAYNPASGTTINGGTSPDTLRVDFSSGVDVIPAAGITYNGGADNGAATESNIRDRGTGAHDTAGLVSHLFGESKLFVCRTSAAVAARCNNEFKSTALRLRLRK